MKLLPFSLRAAWLPCLAAFLCLLSAPALKAQSGTGNIQIICEPGVLVLLDGELKGVTAADLPGLIIREVTAGRHVIKVVKEGFTPQETTVELRSGQNISHRVEPFAPEIKVLQSGQKSAARVERKTGRLLIQSLPISCTINIRGMPLPKEHLQKNDDEWLIAEAPQGDFQAEFIDARGRKLQHPLRIREGQLTHLFVDFLSGKIEVRSAPPDDTTAQRAAALAEARPDPVPVVTQTRSAPPPPVPARPPQEIIAEQQAQIISHETTINRVNEVLAAGGMSIAEIQSATASRQWHQDHVAIARAVIAEQEGRRADAARQAASARRDAFAADIATLFELLGDATLPAAAKNAAWAEVVNKWAVRAAPAKPARGRFEWREPGPVFVGLARLEITTVPAGASLEIRGPDGRITGRSPFISEEAPEGQYAVVAELRGHLSSTGEIFASRDRPGQLVLSLEKARPKEGSTFDVEELRLSLRWIRAGTFTMGSGQGGDSDERPAMQVTLSRGFWLGQTEVTQAQWAAVMGSNPANFKGDDRPVEQVSWNEAMEFCRKLTARERAAGRIPDDLAYTLPTEAQWEYACRAGTTGDYAGNLDAMAWYSANSGSQTHPVGQKQANAWGLHDMHGNVWEWCADWYGGYPGGSVTDPRGAPSGSIRVYRGGSWRHDAVFCRSAYRSRYEPDSRWVNLGFRLALSSVP